MDQNAPLRLPPSNAQTPIARRIRWVLDGVYFDRNSALRDKVTGNNAGDFSPLCVKADSIINIFLAEAIPTPYPNTCQGLPAGDSNRGFVFASNQAFCNTSPAPAQMWAAVGSAWTSYVNGKYIWEMARVINHELCHLLGLNHPFEGRSTCADAPPHPDSQLNPTPPNPRVEIQCWNYNPNDPHCDAWNKVSNNLMDYNAEQSSLSICQIGIMQDNLNTCLADRYVFRCRQCAPTLAKFTLFTQTYGNQLGQWLDGRTSVNEGSFKLEIDQLHPRGTLLPGSHWENTYWRAVGLEYLDGLYTFTVGNSYRIKLTTYDGCSSGPATRTAVYTPQYIRGRPANPAGTPLLPASPASPTSSTLRHE